MNIQQEIKEIRQHLDTILMAHINADFSEVFRYGLNSKIQQAGGIFNAEIKDDDGTIGQKKFFAFKFDPSHDVEKQILYNLKRMFELVDRNRIENELGEWKNIEFNVFKVENLRSKDGFVDLYKGIVYFRRKQTTNPELLKDKMIRDIKNCREVHLGHGTVGIALDTTGTVEVLYNKPVTAVGSEANELAGKLTIELNEKNVCLFFDGKDRIEALDMLIQDLSKIRKNLCGVKDADK